MYLDLEREEYLYIRSSYMFLLMYFTIILNFVLIISLSLEFCHLYKYPYLLLLLFSC